MTLPRIANSLNSSIIFIEFAFPAFLGKAYFMQSTVAERLGMAGADVGSLSSLRRKKSSISMHESRPNFRR